MACDNFCLKDEFAPTADGGGTWSQTGGPETVTETLSVENPCIDFTAYQAGTYTFEYSGGAGACMAAQSYTYVNLDTGDPGTTVSIDKCTSDAAFNIWDELGATDGTDVDWVWSGSGTLQPGYSDNSTPSDATDDTFDPSAQAAGSYVFTLTGTPVIPGGSSQASCCPLTSEATLTVNVSQTFDAGSGGSIAGC